MTTSPYDWIREIPTSLLQLDEIPLLGYPPHFPWEEFAQKLAKTLQIKSLVIKPHDVEWRKSADLFTGIGSHPVPLQFTIPSLEGRLCWVWAERDIHLMMSLLLAKQSKPIDIIDHEFQKGFVHFLAYEICYALNDIEFDKTLTPHILDQEDLPNVDSLCMDISIEIEGQPFLGRLIVSPEFRRSWKERYAVRNLDVPLHPELAEKVQIPVHLEVGRADLTLADWKKMQPGDFVILDFCSLDPTADKGRVMMTVNGLPFFRAKLKDGNIKILEHPLYQEEQTPMAKTPVKDEDFDADFDDESEMEEDSGDESLGLSDLSDDHDQDEEHSELENTHVIGGEEEDVAEGTEKEPDEEAVEEGQAVPAQLDKPSSKRPLTPEEIPLSVIVEVGRIEMSIKTIMELQPGNMLELNVRPENGVDLVVNGKRIGKGELLKLGESLGVRILDIG